MLIVAATEVVVSGVVALPQLNLLFVGFMWLESLESTSVVATAAHIDRLNKEIAT